MQRHAQAIATLKQPGSCNINDRYNTYHIYIQSYYMCVSASIYICVCLCVQHSEGWERWWQEWADLLEGLLENPLQTIIYREWIYLHIHAYIH